jgi:hypothetical protein
LRQRVIENAEIRELAERFGVYRGGVELPMSKGRSSAAKQAIRTRKSRSAGKKAAKTGKLKAADRKAAKTRKRKPLSHFVVSRVTFATHNLPAPIWDRKPFLSAEKERTLQKDAAN